MRLKGQEMENQLEKRLQMKCRLGFWVIERFQFIADT